MSDGAGAITWVRRRASGRVLVFVHGFLGDPLTTWGQMPALLCADDEWGDWDFASFGYETSALPRWNWPSWVPFRRRIPFDEHVRALVSQLEEISEALPTPRFIGLAAHSLGGLLVLAAIRRVTRDAAHDSMYARLLSSIRFVVLYGTPVQGSDRVTAAMALLHKELRPLYRLEPERQELVGWLSEHVRRPLLCLPSGDGATAIVVSVVYSPTDLWVGSREARGLAPGDLEKSISVSHTQLCKPTGRDDARYKALATARERAVNIAVHVRDVLKAEEAFRALVMKIQGNSIPLDIPPITPDRVTEVFRSLAEAPRWTDSTNHYTLIAHHVRVTRQGTVERRAVRAGFRVSSGIADSLDMDVAGDAAMTTVDYSSWSARDTVTGAPLGLDVLDAPNSLRKILRARLPTPIRQRDRFAVEFYWVWPGQPGRDVDCIGFKFQHIPHGLERAEMVIDFEAAPWDVRFFKLKDSAVTEEQPSVQLVASPGESIACRYVVGLDGASDEQWLMAWFAGAPLG